MELEIEEKQNTAYLTDSSSVERSRIMIMIPAQLQCTSGVGSMPCVSFQTPLAGLLARGGSVRECQGAGQAGRRSQER
jgi:hypothetical protein